MAADVRPATEADARELAAVMRAADRAEVLASGGWTALQALQVALDASREAWTLRIDGEVAALFGVAPLVDDVGQAWALTGEVVSRRPVAFFKACRPALAGMLERWPLLVTAVDCRYVQAVRWVERLGFAVGEPEPYGLAGEPFHPILIRRT